MPFLCLFLFYEILCLKPNFYANLQQPISRGNSMREFEDFKHFNIIVENFEEFGNVFGKKSKFYEILCQEPIFYTILCFFIIF